MTGSGAPAPRRFELRWPFVGLAWGVLLGIGSAVLPVGLVWLSGGAADADAWLVTGLWLALFAVVGATYGGAVGLVVGVLVMLLVGRDPEAQAARRTRATLAVIGVPLGVALLRYV